MGLSTKATVALLVLLCSAIVVVRAAAPKAGAAAGETTKTAQPTVDSNPAQDQTKVAGKTDDEANAREAEAISPDGLNAAERKMVEESAQKYEFQAEVTRLMDIIIHSLYSKRDIFLRELISNAADACDKIRFMSLTDKSLADSVTDLDIRIQFDKESRTVTVTDKGIGMTREGLIKNLGIVAHSGTTDFLDKVAAGADTLSLIGQFGVGFYSVYLVADEVTVISKHNDDAQHIWKSRADRTFTVSKDPRGNTLGRGTSVTLHLKEDAAEFLSEDALKKIVNAYSSFINFPIHLLTHREEEKEVPDPEAEAAEAKKGEEKEGEDAEKKDEDKKDEEKKDDVDVKEEDESDDKDKKDEEKKPKTKKVKETIAEWKQLNTNKAIWTRSPEEITEEEYTAFYAALTKDEKGPLHHIHFKAEGEITFRSILYIPKKAPDGYYDKFYEKSTALKLFVRRVLISEEFDDFMPRYLSFIKGVVDSDDLPLNVSRETLAQHRVLQVMGKKLTRKALEMLKKMAERSAKLQEEEKEKKEEEKKEEDKSEDEKKADEKKKEEREMYDTFWTQFGKSIKLGVIDDRANRMALAKLMRFTTSKSDGALRSLQQYVNDMPEKQKYIYYITGENLAAVEKSPMIEKLKKKGFEVLYMVDPLDEYVVQQLPDFDGKKLQSATKELTPEDAADKKRLEAQEKEWEDTTAWLKGVYGDRVEKVSVSWRLDQSPCAVTTGKYGWTANMERIMKAQTFGDKEQHQWMAAKKHLEINPRHPLIKALREKHKADKDDSAAKDQATLLLDSALLVSGFHLDNPADVSARLLRMISVGLGVDPAAQAEAEEEVAEEETKDEKTTGDSGEAASDARDSGDATPEAVMEELNKQMDGESDATPKDEL